MDYQEKQLLLWLYGLSQTSVKVTELLCKTGRNQILYEELYRIYGILSSEIAKNIDQ